MSEPSQNYYIRRAQVLRPDGFDDAPLWIGEGRIVEGASLAREIDASGLLALPGIIDLHGDAFERSVMPRPGVAFPHGIALRDADRQMIAQGITTAYHGLTISWEPGLRTLSAGRAFVDALQAVRGGLAVDTRLHVRWETFALDAQEDVLDWLLAEHRPILAFNDHTTKTAQGGRSARKIAELAERADMSAEAYLDQTAKVWERRDAVPAAIARMARDGAAAGAVLLAHDERSFEDRRMFRAFGSHVCEFPLTVETARDAREHGEAVILGAPNVLRGGSHTGALDASDAIAQGLCTVLASDYYYPAQLNAAFKLAAGERGALARFWPLVSRNPAEAVGLTDRGVLEPGRRADILLVDDAGPVPRVVAAFVAGRLVYAMRDLG